MASAKKVLIKVISAGLIPYLNRRGPIRTPLAVPETLANKLKAQGFNVVFCSCPPPPAKKEAVKVEKVEKKANPEPPASIVDADEAKETEVETVDEVKEEVVETVEDEAKEVTEPKKEEEEEAPAKKAPAKKTAKKTTKKTSTKKKTAKKK